MLTSTSYNQEYYEEHKEAGLDYLGHGHWHDSYAAMIMECTMQEEFSTPGVVDIGCACGSILKSFKDNNLSPRVLGFDPNEYMIQLGRESFGFNNSELVTSSTIPNLDFTPTLIHSAQVFEHISMDNVYDLMIKAKDILHEDGYMFICVDAVRDNEKAEYYMGDPTHINIVETEEWDNLFYDCGLVPNFSSQYLFRSSNRQVIKGKWLGNGKETFYQVYTNWTVYILKKARNKKE